jgi:hypothetical protein
MSCLNLVRVPKFYTYVIMLYLKGKCHEKRVSTETIGV